MRMLVPGPVRSHFENLLLNFTPSELKNFIKYNYSIKNNNMTINEKRLTIWAAVSFRNSTLRKMSYND